MTIFLKFSCFGVKDGVGLKEGVEEGFVCTADFLVDKVQDEWWQLRGCVVGRGWGTST